VNDLVALNPNRSQKNPLSITPALLPLISGYMSAAARAKT